MKTQLQLDESSSKGGAVRKYNGPVDCVKKTVNARGFFGLYRGLSVLLYGSIPKSAVRYAKIFKNIHEIILKVKFFLLTLNRFGAFEECKKLLMNEKGQLTASTRLLAGLGAGVSINNFKFKFKK